MDFVAAAGGAAKVLVGPAGLGIGGVVDEGEGRAPPSELALDRVVSCGLSLSLEGVPFPGAGLTLEAASRGTVGFVEAAAEVAVRPGVTVLMGERPVVVLRLGTGAAAEVPLIATPSPPVLALR